MSKIENSEGNEMMGMDMIRYAIRGFGLEWS